MRNQQSNTYVKSRDIITNCGDKGYAQGGYTVGNQVYGLAIDGGAS